MAIVPRKVENDVRLAPISGEKQDRYEAGAVAGAIGGALQKAGGATMDFAEAQDRADAHLDEAAAKQALVEYNSFANKRLYQDDDAYFNQNGQNALNARAPVQDQLKAKLTELNERLTTPRMRHMFGMAASQEHERQGIAIATYAGKQAEVYNDEQDSALQWQSANDFVGATLRGDGEAAAVARGTMVNSIRSQSARKGLAGAPTQEAEAKAIAGAHASVVQQLAVDDPIKAKEYLDGHRDEIKDQGTLLKLDGALEPFLVEQNSDQIAQMIRGNATGSVPGATVAPYAPTSPDNITANKIVGIESKGDPNARNGQPGQSASGLGQFTDGTWRGLAAKHPEVFGGMSSAQIMAAKTDPAIARKMVLFGLQENRATLGKLGVPVNDGTSRLAWFLGPQAAAKVYKADPNTPVAQLVPAEFVRNNKRLLEGKTAGQVVANAFKEMGGSGAIQRQANAPVQDDLNAQLARVDAMQLPFKQQQAVKQRLMQLAGIDDKLKRDDEEKAADQAWTVALDPKATSIRSIPPAVWARVAPSTQRSIMEALKANAKPVDPPFNPSLYLDLSTKAGNNTLTADDVRNAYGKMPRADWEQAAGWARSAAQAGGKANADSVSLGRINTIVGQAVQARPGLSTVGITEKQDKDGSQRRTISARRYELQKRILSDVSVWQQANPGKKIDDAQIQQIADRQLLQWNRGSDAAPVYRFEAQPGSRGRVAVPNVDIARIRRDFSSAANRQPTEAEISDIYLREARGR